MAMVEAVADAAFEWLVEAVADGASPDALDVYGAAERDDK